MKLIILLISLVQFSCTTISCGQTKPYCDIIYNSPQIKAHNKWDDKTLIDYVAKELSPIIIKCSEKDSSELISSLNTQFIIDKKGKVIDVSILTKNIGTKCKSELRKKMLTMGGWVPGKINGKLVCSRVNFPITCLKWEQ